MDRHAGAFPQNKGIYCREWDPLNPKVNEIVFKLMDEIVDAFKADALHVGMDEIFSAGLRAIALDQGATRPSSSPR